MNSDTQAKNTEKPQNQPGRSSRSDVTYAKLSKVLNEALIKDRNRIMAQARKVFGTRQHGIPDTHLADMISHIDIMEEMRGYAMDVLEEDRELAKPENRKLKERVNMLFSENVTMNL